uniref:Uncharacterized protein n=1 Tax=Amphimedon queenslandica TaxID=400682 RepID=A0A1X7TT83_AMPQE
MLTSSLWVILELVKVLLVMSSRTQLLALLFLETPLTHKARY